MGVKIGNIPYNKMDISIEKSIINDYLSGYSGKELEKKYRYCDSTIFNVLHRNNIAVKIGKFKKGHMLNRGKKYNLNDAEIQRRSLLGKTNLGKIRSLEFCHKQSLRYSGEGNPNFGNHWSEDIKHKISSTNRAKWKDKEFIDNWLLTHANLYKTKNKTESVIESVIKDHGFEYVGDSKFWIGYPPKNPDFINKDKKLIVELFGDYWHETQDEVIRSDHFKKYGWNTIVVWSSDLHFNPTTQNSLNDNDKTFLLNKIGLYGGG
jgi:G:T-mismatch repair DNA endonuclease (very short patch repair protein)